MTSEGPPTERRPQAAEIEVVSATKTYGPTTALERCTFEVYSHEVVGLVGENGAGKSTLVGILNGTVVPDGGELRVRGSTVAFGQPKKVGELGIATVFQEQNLVPTLAVFENMFLGREDLFEAFGFVRRRRMRLRAQAILDELGIRVHSAARTIDLSFGERQLVEIAKAFAQAELVATSPVILLDEPTSALGDSEVHLLFDRIREWRQRASFVFVSHRLEDVLAITDRLVVLKDGRRLDARQTAGVTEEQLHEVMVGRKRDREYYRESLQQRVDASKTSLLKVNSLAMSGAFYGVSLSVSPGEIVGVAGVLGSGKSELALTIAGGLKPTTGSISVSGAPVRTGSVDRAIKSGIGYVPPERASEGLIPYLSVTRNLTLAGLRKMRWANTPLLDPRRESAFAQLTVQRLGIKGKPSWLCAALSGGNQQKVVLGKWMLNRPKVLVMDDPTRGIDVGAKEEIYALIRQWAQEGLSFLIASDNLHEVIGLSNRILVMKDGGLVAEIPAPPDAKPSEEEVVRYMV